MSSESAARGSTSGTPRGVPVVNVANALTVSRLAMVPFFLFALFWDGGQHAAWRWVAAAIFVVASITDRVDGELARRRGLVTDFGKIADPIADKALTGSALIGLSLLGDLPWWVTLVIIARELAVTGLRFWVIRHGVIPASRGGKLKTALQAVAIGLYLVPLGDAAELLRWTAMGAAVLATVVTGLDYVVRAVRLRAMGKRAMHS
ncbi:CDP-diacylglycerol--glycerol-3-phosphate 3-phosphatidyltransferase [Allosaccharopolyspora coralli]|uniref:CDP-diacylglycerol--glycerol-3-phosphate 3-phosphatidyltransferase n=1 Tax=Allosaccharopolyspora coralli TaxID=2665642 RepID=A0A5Q3Q8P2_9PSEU|nr:CDP-diacylglycerol--glycerol-3-phosphate 3-phosphatidyltransferase [Allosaccharopolyspora coralli]QGK70918.1 CDP-diacylglycerol--glycerol-3-phosphate 3-phosphatidyltransferase [Allosaccharopolyspora coralli]